MFSSLKLLSLLLVVVLFSEEGTLSVNNDCPLDVDEEKFTRVVGRRSLGGEKVERLDSHIKAICVPSPASGQLWSLLTIPATFILTPDDGPNFPSP